MANYKRLGFRGRHLIRQLRRSRHASVQRTLISELKAHISGRHGHRIRQNPPKAGRTGHYRPLTHKAKQLLTRLRRSRVWSAQKSIVNELTREIERGRRLVDRARARAQAARRRAQSGWARTQRARRAVVTRTRNGWNRARPHVARAQEPFLRRAERRQAERTRGLRKPRMRDRAAGRARRAWSQVRPGRSRPQPVRAPRPAVRPARVPSPAARTRPLRPVPSRAARPAQRPARTPTRATR